MNLTTHIEEIVTQLNELFPSIQGIISEFNKKNSIHMYEFHAIINYWTIQFEKGVEESFLTEKKANIKGYVIWWLTCLKEQDVDPLYQSAVQYPLVKKYIILYVEKILLEQKLIVQIEQRKEDKEQIQQQNVQTSYSPEELEEKIDTLTRNMEKTAKNLTLNHKFKTVQSLHMLLDIRVATLPFLYSKPPIPNKNDSEKDAYDYTVWFFKGLKELVEGQEKPDEKDQTLYQMMKSDKIFKNYIVWYLHRDFYKKQAVNIAKVI